MTQKGKQEKRKKIWAKSQNPEGIEEHIVKNHLELAFKHDPYFRQHKVGIN